MDNILNSKIDKQTIYDIYRACRLCGAGAGYKMPIIQNVVDLDSNGIELKQKIRECVQIEVHPDDKMPPLICELCVDKVNDFYDFMGMCQQTNKRTRMRLGLPMQSTGKVRNSKYDSGDCILGVTEQVYGNDDSDEPLSAKSRPKMEPKVKIKVEKTEKENSRDSRSNSRESRSKQDTKSRSRTENSREARSQVENSREYRSRDSRLRVENSRDSESSRSPTPVRVTRQKRPPTPPRRKIARSSVDESVSLSTLKQQGKKSTTPSAPPKSILKKDTKTEEPSKSKRTRDPPKSEVPQKKVKLVVETPAGHACSVCSRTHTTSQALGNHMRSHVPTYTSVRLSCNACSQWFPTAEEAAAHHRSHKTKRKPYRCRRCGLSYTQQEGYDDHIGQGKCIPWPEVPDVKCPECWRLFPTTLLLDQHRCGGPATRPGGKCMSCKRSYALLKNLTKHQETCKKKKSEVVTDPGVMESLRPASIRLARCDPLLTRENDGHYDVAGVPEYFGSIPGSSYPYRRPPMVSIKAELDFSDDERSAVVHWDSDDDDGVGVAPLSTLSLKTIFSKKFLGKVPRKRRKIETEKSAFDCLLNSEEFDSDFSKKIDFIIDNLINDRNLKKPKDNDNDSVNSESLLVNDKVNDTRSNDGVENSENNDNQSLVSNEISDKNTVHNNSSETKLERDRDNLSTDCETEMEDNLKESEAEDKLKDSRLSNTENDIKCTNVIAGANDSRDNDDGNRINDYDNTTSNNDLDIRKDNESRNENNDAAKDSQDNGNDEHLKGVSYEENSEDDRKLMEALDEQINETNCTTDNDEVLRRNESSSVNDDSNINNDVFTENNDGEINKNERVTNEQISLNNEVKIDDRSTENCVKENNEHLNDLKDHSTSNNYNESEAICNDIENKINDLIALRNHSENNDGSDFTSNNVTENNDMVGKNCENDANTDKYTQNKDVGKEKICLEDFGPRKDEDAKSMDLDSISDEEFNFDA